MKSISTLYCLLLMLPINAAAHPGHGLDAAFAGLSGSQPWSLAALAAAGLVVVAYKLRRWRKTLRADD